MAPRFLAFIGSNRDLPVSTISRLERTAGALGLVRVLHSAQAIVFAQNGAPPLALDAAGGVILGTVFTGIAAPRQLAHLDEATQQAIKASKGLHLVENFWGGYVAILPEDTDVHVVRDPSGFAPCYYLQWRDLTVAASGVDILTACGLLIPEIDWTHIAEHLVANGLRTARTGIVGLVELEPGTRLTLRDRIPTVHQLWSPWTFAARDQQILDAETAAELLHQSVVGCVGAWASLFEHPLLSLSGGLDSSIVAAGLARSSTKFSCITLAAHDPKGDERAYARAVCSKMGAPLFEAYEEPADVDVRLSEASHLPRPLARAFEQSGNRQQLDIAGREGCDAFFGGGGGDNIFCYLQSVGPIADRLLMQGPGFGAWRTVADISKLTGCSAWTATTRAIQRAWFRSPHYRWPLQTMFLTGPAIERAGQWYHAWLDAPADALPGKAAHIAMIMAFLNHMEGYNRELTHPVISPLMSQPLIELCLRIPSWMWCAGGLNRSLARVAFNRDLPDEILRRRSKGSPSGFAIEILEAQRTEIREMLTDGHLARQGFLDLERINQFINNFSPMRGGGYAHLLRLVDVEAWIDAWVSKKAVGALASAS